MKKRNVGFTRNFTKLIGTALALSLVLSTNVHAEELEELVDSEDITTISDGIDTLDEKVDALNDNCQDESLSDDISDISGMIDVLNETISKLSQNYYKLSLTINKNRQSIIEGLNKSVYANDNISGNATYSDIISKINSIKYQGSLAITPDGNGNYTFESGYYDGGTIDVSAIIEAARQEGKEEAYKEGFAAGKEQGIKIGKEQGYKEGLEAGKDFIMTSASNWLSITGSSCLAISPYITYKSYRYIYVRNSVNHNVPLNNNDVIHIWIKSGDNAWGRKAIDRPISSGEYVGDGWYRFGVNEGISIVEVINNNGAQRDYFYRFSN